jgi:hypothetical protein
MLLNKVFVILLYIYTAQTKLILFEMPTPTTIENDQFIFDTMSASDFLEVEAGHEAVLECRPKNIDSHHMVRSL